MAEAVGDLPIMDFPYTVGDVASYPSTPNPDGGSLNDDNMLFSDATTYTVSDVGGLWDMRTSQSVTNSVSMSQDIGVSAGVTVGGMKVGVGASYGWGQGYSLRVGESASFSGAIPALPDDLNTPEDEYQRYAYQVTPYVYTQPYTTDDDEAAIMMTYTSHQ